MTIRKKSIVLDFRVTIIIDLGVITLKGKIIPPPCLAWHIIYKHKNIHTFVDFHLLVSTMDKALKSPLSFRTQYKFNCLNKVKEKY